MIRVAAAIAAVAVFLAAFGCGGSSDDEQLSKSEYVSKANSICKKARQERQQLLVKAGKDVTNIELLALLETKSIPRYQQMVEELSKLGLPEGSEEQAEQALAAMRKAGAEAKADYGKAGGSIVKADKEVEALGLNECVF